MIEEGSYRARGCEAALGVAGTGNQQIGIDFELLEGPNTGSHITWYGSFSEKAFDRTIESMRLAGWEGIDLADLRGIGRTEVRLTIGHEQDNYGEVHAKAQWVNSLGGVVMKERMDLGAAAAFAAQMRGRILAADAKRGTPPTASTGARTPPAQRAASERPTGAPATSTPSDGGSANDDIPF